MVINSDFLSEGLYNKLIFNVYCCQSNKTANATKVIHKSKLIEKRLPTEIAVSVRREVKRSNREKIEVRLRKPYGRRDGPNK